MPPLRFRLPGRQRRRPLRRLALAGVLLAAAPGPAAASSGAVSGRGSSLALTAPVVSSVTPSTGPVLGGSQVTITGSGFACPGSDEVWFGTDVENGYAITAPSVQVLSDSEIVATVPANFGGGVDVRVRDACGTSPVQGGDHFTYEYPSTQCLSGTCSVAVGTGVAGALTHSALGFLDGFNTDAGVTITPGDATLVGALHPRQWRLGQAGLSEPQGGLFGLARYVGAQISLDLTSDWEDWAYSNDRAYWQAPYGDLAAYSSFLYRDVEQRLAAGQAPDYYDVWNEPATTGTVSQWLSVYGAAYRAIKAADPNARIVGPSIATFLMTSANQGGLPGYELSLTDFLDWEMASGARFAAVSWHEDGTTVPGLGAGGGAPDLPIPGGYRDAWTPAAIATHVSLAKGLIASYPALAGTQVFVNEYGPTYAANVPGWMVGDFAALERSGADQAMLTCVSGAACSNLLDGLIGTDGAPQMPYWVMDAYAQMSGQRLAGSASGSNLYVLASRPNGASAVQALIGRADDCWGGEQCPQFHGAVDGPVQLSLLVAVPWTASAVDVTVQRLPDSATGPLGANDVAATPDATTISGVPVLGGQATVDLGSAADGDAFYVTVSPSAAGDPAPAPSAGPGTPAPSTRPGTPAPSTRPGTPARWAGAGTAVAARAAKSRPARRRRHRRRTARVRRGRPRAPASRT